MELEKIESVEQVKEALIAKGFAIGLVNPVKYHEWKKDLPHCVSKSSLCSFIFSPYVYHYKKVNEVDEETEAMARGSLVDCLTLTPELYADMYTAEKVDRRTKEGKERYAEMLERGTKLITPEKEAEAMFIAEHATEAIRHSTEGDYQTQVAMWMRLEQLNGHKLACPLIVCGMLDVMPNSESLPLIDLKTSSVDLASDYHLLKQVVKMNYGMQAAMYIDLFRVCTGQKRGFSFVFVGSGAPHRVRTYNMNEDDILSYQIRYCEALRQFAACEKANNWGDFYLPDISDKLPAWAFSD